MLKDDNKKKLRGINVSVGYEWQEFYGDNSKLVGADVRHDTFWKSLKGMFVPTCQGLKDKGVNVNFARLRSCQGRLVWPSIENRIIKADVLIFDIAASQLKKMPFEGVVQFQKVIKTFNHNVLLEIGFALGQGKRVLLMCPNHLFNSIPSDLRGFHWTVYKGYFKDGEMIRNFADSCGAIAAFRSLMLDAWKEKNDTEANGGIQID